MIASYSMKDFYDRCDALIEDWLNPHFNKTLTFRNDPFLKVQKKPNDGLLKPDYINLIPELFYGDPDSNLAVFLNLNPGFGKNDSKYIGKASIKNQGVLSCGYSCFARTNPYLINPLFHPDAYDWWQKRLKWLKAIFEYSEKKLPFIMELCPWHSKRWSDAGIAEFNTSQKQYIQQNVLAPAAYAAKNSVAGFVISIGKAYTTIYPSLGFNLVKEWKPGVGIHGWPRNPKTGKDKQVHFEYYKNLDGIKILSIWLWGSNKTPCNEFLPIEKEIVTYIRNH